jgi:hypothetical protein
MGADILVTFEHKLKERFVSFSKALRSLSDSLWCNLTLDYLAHATGAVVRIAKDPRDISA